MLSLSLYTNDAEMIVITDERGRRIEIARKGQHIGIQAGKEFKITREPNKYKVS